MSCIQNGDNADKIQTNDVLSDWQFMQNETKNISLI